MNTGPVERNHVACLLSGRVSDGLEQDYLHGFQWIQQIFTSPIRAEQYNALSGILVKEGNKASAGYPLHPTRTGTSL